MSKFYVYWNAGSCNYGDHRCGLQDHETLEQAKAHVEKLKSEQYWDDKTDDVTIIQGREVDIDA
jgi:hypothetical protein